MLPDNVFKLRLKGSEKCITKGGSSCLDEIFKSLCANHDGNGSEQGETTTPWTCVCILHRSHSVLNSKLEYKSTMVTVTDTMVTKTTHIFHLQVQHNVHFKWLTNLQIRLGPRLALNRLRGFLDAILKSSFLLPSFYHFHSSAILQHCLVILGRNKTAPCQLASAWFSSARGPG